MGTISVTTRPPHPARQAQASLAISMGNHTPTAPAHRHTENQTQRVSIEADQARLLKRMVIRFLKKLKTVKMENVSPLSIIGNTC